MARESMAGCEEQASMTTLAEQVVGRAKKYVAPAITGLSDLLDRQSCDRPEGQLTSINGSS
jgi:hypothetical protein